MTAKQFDYTVWYKGIKVKYLRKEREVVTVDFVKRVIGIISNYGYPMYVKHLKCELIPDPDVK
jgi:hypothetical protein